MTIVLPHGVLFRGGEEGGIRKNLIEQNHIDTIIGLPSNIFFGTGIPTIIMVLKKKRTVNDVLIIDASKGFNKVGKNNVLRASDIKKVADTVINREGVFKFSKVVSQEEIRQTEYNLNIPRYVDSSASTENWDIYASLFGGIPKDELDGFADYWNTFKGLQKKLFSQDGTPYSALAVSDREIENVINEHKSVIEWKTQYNNIFSDFKKFLHDELITNMMTLNISKEESMLSGEIFKRLETIALVDKYNAYQLLNDEWIKTAVDLEILQTEGFEAAKKVDPNMVLKKKNGKESEVQDGYIGHVIPFELVQSTILKEEACALKQKEESLAKVQSGYEEIIDSLSQEEKDFGASPETESELKQLLKEEKELNAQIKKDFEALHLQTKTTIENLTDAQVNELLELKWIAPLTASLQTIVGSIIADFVADLRTLVEKYAATYSSVATQIAQTKSSLAAMIDDLSGNEYDMKGLNEFKALLKTPLFGCAKGQFKMADDFNEPLDDFKEYM